MNNPGVKSLAVAALALVLYGVQTPTFKSDIRNGRSLGGYIHLPTGQTIHPWGRVLEIPGRPVDVALEPSRGWLAILNFDQIDLVDAKSGAILSSAPIAPASYTGIAFRPGSSELWASEIRQTRDSTVAEDDSLAIFSIDTSGRLERRARFSFRGHAIPAGIAFSPDGLRAFVALNGANTLAVVDTVARKIIREMETDVAPFGVAVADGGRQVFVTNRGGRRPAAGNNVARSAMAEVAVDGNTGSVLPGTVSVVDTASGSVRSVPAGLAPAAIAISPDALTVAVANAHGDTITLIDRKGLRTTSLSVPGYPAGTTGAQPTGLSFAADGNRLYVTCAGTNALAVFSRRGRNWSFQGAIPTAWFPSALVVDSRTGIHVVSTKGMENTLRDAGHYVSTAYHGALETIAMPTQETLRRGDAELRKLNAPRFEAASGAVNPAALGIEHVVLIVKENRTYDQVFGDIPEGNGDPGSLFYGRDVTPNAHALAEQFVLLDNFYTSGAISFDGHQWLMMAFASDHTERAFPASPRGYAWNMSDALTVAPTGFFWQAAGKPLDVRIYGEFCADADAMVRGRSADDMTGNHFGSNWKDNMRLYKAGKLPALDYCAAGVPALSRFIDRKYPVSLDITDQFKADEFMREFSAYESAGHLPGLSVVMLNNDHTQGTRPGAGTPRAMVADNDLALGRIVERISQSPFWSSTLILVTEDDAQAGVDHVDGRRTICLAIGPHVRRKAVVSDNYDHLSLVRTIQQILGVPPRTRFAASARTMDSIFTTAADLAGFTHLPARTDVEEMNPALTALRGQRRWAAEQSARMDFEEVDSAPPQVLNRILWLDSHGYDSTRELPPSTR